MNKVIAHLDMDAFFASVEERENPRWQGLPIVVGADPHSTGSGQGHGRGVVSTANYPARKYGIHSAMPISRAWKLSEEAAARGEPKAIFLPVNGKLYSEVSDKICVVIKSVLEQIYPPPPASTLSASDWRAGKFAPAKLERASIDECYFALPTENYSLAEKTAKEIKTAVKTKERLTCSIGLGPNKLIAKIASGKNKPDGLTIVEPDQVLDFLAPLLVRELPGVGPKTDQQLAKLKINYIRELRRLDAEQVQKLFGKWGAELLQKAYGIGSTEITEEYETKSIGEQETFMQDTLDSLYINERLAWLATAVIARFKRSEFKTFRTLVLTIRFSDFKTQTRSHTLSTPTSELKILKTEALKLLLPFLDSRANPNKKLIRLIGVRIEKLK